MGKIVQNPLNEIKKNWKIKTLNPVRKDRLDLYFYAVSDLFDTFFHELSAAFVLGPSWFDQNNT